jgi:putative salt-induced outer membrane protein
MAQDKVKTTGITADLGFVNASGNTSVTTLNIGEKFTANTTDKRVVFTQAFGAVRSRSDGVISAQNYRAQLRLDYGLGGRVYLFGLTGWDKNVPGGVRRRFEETVGLALKAVAAPQDELGIEAGLSMFQQRNTVASAGDLDDNFTAGRAAANYKRAFTKTSSFTQLLELIPNFDDSEDFRLNSESAIIALVSSNIGLKLSYLIRYDNLPGLKPGSTTGERLAKTDRFLTAGITASY